MFEVGSTVLTYLVEIELEETSARELGPRAAWKLSLYILWVAAVSAILCAVNTGMVFALTNAIESQFPELLGIKQLLQFILATVPATLTFLEWYVWDILTTRRGRI